MANHWLIKSAVNLVGKPLAGNGKNRVVVLCYHSIHPSKSFSSVTPEMFGRHLEWLKEHCEVVAFSEVFSDRAHARSNGPSIAITFDDGHADNYEFAFPLLAEHGVSATWFLTAGLMEKEPQVLARFQKLRESTLEDIRPMEWSQVREMAKAGMVFGAHTYSHPNLALLDRPAARDELERSKEILEDRLGRSITSMAYPFGKPRRHFTDETVDIAAECGYQYAAAVLYHRVDASDSRYSVPRFCITRDDVPTLAEKVFGCWDIVGTWQRHAPLWLAGVVSPQDFAGTR